MAAIQTCVVTITDVQFKDIDCDIDLIRDLNKLNEFNAKKLVRQR